MQFFLQVFDAYGAAQLNGDSNFKDHIGWLTLQGWDRRPDLTPDRSQELGRDRSQHQAYKELGFSLLVSPITTTLQSASADPTSTSGWSKATLDCFDDDGKWFLRVTITDPRISSVQIGSSGGTNPGAPAVAAVRMTGTGLSVDYRDWEGKGPHVRNDHSYGPVIYVPKENKLS
jgi:hypothetical protein